jgi:hypothetical protein
VPLGCCYILLLFTIGFKLWFAIIFLLVFFLLVSHRKLIFLRLQRITSITFSRYIIQKTEHFLLDDTGGCQFNNQQKLQLSVNSQINLWGYWLVFTDTSAIQKFIFKDSLSAKDQARVARTIMRIRQFPNLAIKPL